MEITPCLEMETINIVKMPILPTLINRFNVIPIKIPKVSFVDIDKLQSTWKFK